MMYVFDIETDGLYRECTKIHCLSYCNLSTGKVKSLTNYDEIISFISQQNITLIGHNIIRFDIPVIEKLLNISFEGNVIDTLGISWYLFPERKKHGLESYGEEFNLPKPYISDWNNLSIQDYVNRCETDVKINTLLWKAQEDYLSEIYENKQDDYFRLIGYLNFKLDCLKEQEIVGITLDISLCEKTYQELELLIDEKLQTLISVMPADLGNVIRKKPTNFYKKDGTLTIATTKWFDLLKELNLPLDTEVVYDKPNPGSPVQLKKWLDMLGWKPATFKISKNTGEKVAQVSLPFGQGLCPSVKELFTVEPNLQALDDLFMLQHRLGLVKSLLENVDENGKVYATAHGLTNTLRLTHSVPIVNLPSIFKPYGKEIRGSLTVPSTDIYYFFGADISGLEDKAKCHYIYFFDPKYVKEMLVPGFDAHVDIALLSKMMTPEEAELYKVLDKKEEKTPEEKKEFLRLKEIRGEAKQTNFASTYGALPPKLSEILKKPVEFAEKLYTAYWERNKAIKQVANSTLIKTVYGQKWQYNPIAGIWYYLKAEKDKFNTLNQGTGSYIFDYWLRKSREKLNPLGINIILQYHDELAGICLKFQKDIVKQKLQEAMDDVNNDLGLNVTIGFEVDFGTDYASVH